MKIDRISQDVPVLANSEIQLPEFPAWRKPTITRIGLKRTLFGSGPSTDFEGQTSD